MGKGPRRRARSSGRFHKAVLRRGVDGEKADRKPSSVEVVKTEFRSLADLRAEVQRRNPHN